MNSPKRERKIYKLTLLDILPEELKKGLKPSEEILLNKAQTGEYADLRTGDAQGDDPRNAEEWGEERMIRSEFIYWLCTDSEAVKLVHAKGVRIVGAIIPTKLDFENCILIHPIALFFCAVNEGISIRATQLFELHICASLIGPIWADDLKASGTLNLEKTTVKGEIRLPGAKIGGDLSCMDAKLKNPGGAALSADRSLIEGSVFFMQRFQAEGEITLRGAKIGGDLDCRGATIRNPREKALDASMLRTESGVYLIERFKAEGEVRLSGAKIGGDLDCRSAMLSNLDGNALYASYMETGGYVFLGESFLAEGEVHLSGAKIGGSLDCSGAKLKKPGGKALHADSLMANGSVNLRKGFQAEGEVRFPGAKIGGDLNCGGASLKNPNGYALVLQAAQIREKLVLTELRELVGLVVLSYAQVGVLVDDVFSWPKERNLWLDGFEYGAFAGSPPISVEDRLRWLALQPNEPFYPQPYAQLAKVFRSIGREDAARTVLIEKQEALRKYGDLSKKRRIWNWFLGKTISHGYIPSRVILRFIIPIILIGWAFFWFAETQDLIRPAKDRAYTEYSQTHKIPENYPNFHPLVYSLDVFIPFVDLYQKNYWLPVETKLAGTICWVYIRLHIAFGWIFSSLAVAGLTGLVRKE